MLRNFRIPFRLIIFTYVFGLVLSPLAGYAQVVDAEFEQVETTPPEEKDLEQLKEEAIKNSRIPLDDGVHIHPKTGKKYFVSWGEARIGAPYNSKNFINSRQSAFTKAMADAKREMVTFIAQDIESKMTLIMEQPSESRAQAEVDAIKSDVMGIEEKRKAANAAQADLEKKGDEWGASVVNATAKGVNRVYQNELDQQLRAKGIDPNQPVDKSAIQAVINSNKFSEITKIMARHKVVGMQAYKTFEVHPKGKDPAARGEMGVLAIWSPKLNNLGRAIVSGDTRLIPPGTPKAPLKKQVPKVTNNLLMTFGVQMKMDQNGSPALVSFCQAGQKGKSGKRAAIKKAKVCAAKQIRQYAGEALVSSTQDQSAESETEFKDGTLDYENEDSLDDLIETTAKNMTITGISNLHTWKTKHPVTGQMVRGAVVYWSPSASKMAKALGQQVTAPRTKASETTNQKRTAPVKKQQPPISREGFAGSGGAASDEF